MVGIPTIVIPVMSHQDPTAITMNFLQRPSLAHVFGTDGFGRDTFIRVLYGTRVSLAIGLGTMLTTSVVGAAIGLVIGLSHSVDIPLMWLMDLLLAFPPVLLALGIMVALGQTPSNVLFALSLLYIPRTARVVRSVVLSVMQQQYVEAYRATGGGPGRLLLRHVLPNTGPALIVQATFVFGYAILAEAGLSFIGVGDQPPTPSLGNILADARTTIQEAPWLVFLPGLWTFVLVMAINLLGDGLREIIDPRLERAGRM